MLDHSRGSASAPDEWLTVARARQRRRPAAAGPMADAQTAIILRVKGSDLAAFLARQISRDEARHSGSTSRVF